MALGELPPDARVFVYRHPGSLDGTPTQVARRAASDLDEAAAVFARHVVAAVRQARNGFLTEQQLRDPELSPRELAERWEGSPEELACRALVRAAKLGNTGVKALRGAQR